MKLCTSPLTILAAWYLVIAIELSAHSPLHHTYSLKPTIVTHYDDPKAEQYVGRSDYYEPWAHFTRYDEHYLNEHALPNGTIPPRYKQGKPVSGAEIRKRFNEATAEIFKARKRIPFKGITILKDRDWNYPHASGLIIFKFNDLPFVIKLYRETPQTYVSPLSKGLEPALFWVMSGGINRYQLGFTRIKNGITVQQMLQQDPVWAHKVTLPREWYLVPDDVPYFIIEGYNMGCDKSFSIRVPSMYAIVCDWIEQERAFLMSNPTDRQTAMDIARILKNRIDPNIKNFIIEKNTGLIAIIDTEHFASVVGLRENIDFRNYWNWYTRLAGEFLKRGFATTLPARHRIRCEELPDMLKV